MKDIIDVSRYQGVIDWQKVKDAGEIGGVMLKTISTNKAFGGIYCDPMFERNYAECKRLGIPVGVYYYTYAQDTIRARQELAALHDALEGKELDLPCVVDVEDNKLKPISKAQLTSLVEYAARRIQSWGLYSMIYTYTSYANTELDISALELYDIWIADYRGKEPLLPHGIWQYTSKGKVPGINGDVDMSHATKNYPAIIHNAGLTRLRK